MSLLRMASDKLNAAVKYFCFVLLSLMTVIIVIQVFWRYVLGSSLSWSEESARYLFIWTVMLGASIGIKDGFHVTVTFFVDLLPVKIKNVVELFFCVVLMIIATAMIVYGFDLAFTVSIQQSPAIRLSMLWVYLAVPVSGSLIAIHLVNKFGEIMAKFSSPNERSSSSCL